ncbi:AraC family transcriptional regulator [Winogradskyella sp. R77965]|uniref:AraC family transcriptional regulator n=1 Tax=Winogradskyella sp. R77965 TaxID=3093872 RepID=UPI0037DC9627
MKILSFINQKQAFPLHYHKEYCISIIKYGVELLNIGDEQYIGNVNDITITHPYELHSNPLFSLNNLLSFHTLYISEETVRSILPFRNTVYFEKRVVKNEQLNILFEKLLDCDAKNQKLLLHKFITLLSNFGELSSESKTQKPLKSWESIDMFIDQNIKEPITLERMATIANLNKYSFARKFKQTTGISPVHYTLMKKVFHCKETMTTKCSITDKAYEYNFTDISHFSKSFKKFIGIRPKIYQQNFIK